MKRGFTLIELLAVIVILAIIALIATPIVLNIINDTKESATLRSAEFYLDGVETAIATATLKNIKIQDGTYNIMSNGDICTGTYDEANDTCTIDPLPVEMDGEKPNSGTVTITKGQISDVTLKLSDKTITKNNKGELVLEKEPVCKLVENGDVAPAGISAGDKYQCKVKDNMETGFEDGYYFYVLSQESDGTTNLIMDRNICKDGTVVNEQKTCLTPWINDVDYCGEAESGCARVDNGPVTAMNFLNNATSTWKYIDNLNITYDDEGGNFTGFKITGKARFPYKREINQVNCKDNSVYSCPVWMIDYMNDASNLREETYQENPISGISGYFIFSTDSSSTAPAQFVLFTGCIGNDVVTGSYGIRPVINIKL